MANPGSVPLKPSTSAPLATAAHAAAPQDQAPFPSEADQPVTKQKRRSTIAWVLQVNRESITN